MNKKLTSLSLAGVMLLSTASPVFAEAENAMKEAKETSKVEQLAKDAKEAGKEVAKDAKEKMTEAKEKAEEKMTEAKKDAKVVKEEVKKDVKEVKEEVKKEVKEVKTVDVKATTQKVKLDGKDVVIYGYNIDGYNYFKLRDLAAVLKDSQAKFGVEYKDGVVTLTKAADYKVAESDQKEVKAMSKGMLTNDKVLVGDKTLTATAYKVDDSNYYKLRDLGKELGFGVGYDEATKSVLLTSVVNKEEVKEEKVAPKLEELKEAVKKELANEKEVRESEAYKKADDKVKSNFENAVAAAKSLLADEKATAEQFTNELKALVEAKEQLGFKADVKVEEKKEAKEAKKEMEKDVKEAKKEMKKDVKEAKEEVKETAKEAK
ncbi:hypothetical protein QP518_04490 [Peptoniphilus harei]|uniref:hypothetical protein n=1 Tax=Peptoniphilus harei TaxID=54005 RepID=UPI0025510B71|nr:hypothetical protein [Peptoniphilus harei]MDK7355002.1 hypothetical protein [Peptoniphilus harei]MDK7370596.1 hypothetical protein [Peptoniphilus harei]